MKTATRLHSDTIALLAERIDDVLDQVDLCIDADDRESADEWTTLLQSMIRVLDVPTVETLAAEKEAASEICDTLSRDEFRTTSGSPNSKGRRIDADLCRAGVHDVFNPEAYYSHRPKTMIVDGVRYCVG